MSKRKEIDVSYEDAKNIFSYGDFQVKKLIKIYGNEEDYPYKNVLDCYSECEIKEFEHLIDNFDVMSNDEVCKFIEEMNTMFIEK